MNADGSGQRRLTRNTVEDANPVWSPDGRRIAFVSNWQVWVMNADGSGQRRLTRTNGARNVAPAGRPTGGGSRSSAGSDDRNTEIRLLNTASAAGATGG